MAEPHPRVRPASEKLTRLSHDVGQVVADAFDPAPIDVNVAVNALMVVMAHIIATVPEAHRGVFFTGVHKHLPLFTASIAATGKMPVATEDNT